MIKKFKHCNKKLVLLIVLAFIVKLFYFCMLGYEYTINSDDLSYVISGIVFLETGKITLLGEITAQVMPGMTFIIAFFAFIFGKGKILFLSLKIFWIFLGTLSVLYFFKILKLLTKSNTVAFWGSLPFLALDYAWTDNIILTETPYIFSTIMLLYFSVKYINDSSRRNFIMIILFYIISLMIRPTIALFPIFLVSYLLFIGHDKLLTLKRAALGIIVLIILLLPWTIRNYKLYDKLIPLTYGIGNPLLLGTYQGINYPTDESLDYDINVKRKLDKKILSGLELTQDDPNFYMKKYYQLVYDQEVAKYRMKTWWERNPKSMIVSYLYYKPKEMIHSTFYWDTVFKYDTMILKNQRRVETLLFILSLGVIIYFRKHLKIFAFIFILYTQQILLYSYTFAFGRYSLTLYFLKYIIIALGINILYTKYTQGQKNRANIKLFDKNTKEINS